MLLFLMTNISICHCEPRFIGVKQSNQTYPTGSQVYINISDEIASLEDSLAMTVTGS